MPFGFSIIIRSTPLLRWPMRALASDNLLSGWAPVIRKACMSILYKGGAVVGVCD